MDDKLLSVLIGTAAGAVGYWFTTFWMKPILQYRELRSKVLVDLLFYAQVINADGLNERMQKLHSERIESNRRASAQFVACILELPVWYRYWLRLKGHSPAQAATHLLGFSNTTEYDVANKRVERIKEALGFKTEAI